MFSQAFPDTLSSPLASRSILYPLAELLPCIPLPSIAPSQHRPFPASPLPSIAVPPKPHIVQSNWVNNRLAEGHPPWQHPHPPKGLVSSDTRHPQEHSGPSTGREAAKDQRERRDGAKSKTLLRKVERK